MRSIYVADVDDGLCMAVYTIFREVVQIDCGGQKVELAFKGLKRIFNHFLSLDAFVLSHFHIDHYCGLLYASTNSRARIFQTYPHFRIRDVYYPRIPEFRDRKEFLRELFTINLRIFGSETGIMEYDFLKAISRMNAGNSFWHKPLSRGNSININGSIFKVLWPPERIDSNKTLADIRQALEDFKTALEEDDTTRELYERIKDEGLFEDYLKQSGEKYEFRQSNNGYTYANASKKEKRELPRVVEEANKSLRKAANHLGLALFEDNRLLFLGDAENFEIRQIVGELKAMGRDNFFVFIAPHHGTHWHNSLGKMRCIYSIASNGSKLCSRMNPHFKGISEKSFATFVNGDIVMPSYYTTRFWGMPSWFY